jgi:hypothetical protein
MTVDSKYWYCSRRGRVHQLSYAFRGIHIMNLHSFNVVSGLVLLLWTIYVVAVGCGVWFVTTVVQLTSLVAY